MSSRNTPGYRPAAAIELVWWKQPAFNAAFAAETGEDGATLLDLVRKLQ